MHAHTVLVRAGALLGAGLLAGNTAAHAIDDALFPLTDSLPWEARCWVSRWTGWCATTATSPTPTATTTAASGA